MTNTTNAAAIESLRTFAAANNEIEFAHLCTAAIAGEQWAIDRVVDVVRHLKSVQFALGGATDERRIAVIRTTDTSRPDGAIARKFEI